MDIDDNYLEIIEEIPKSPTNNNRLNWKSNQIQHIGASHKYIIELKQANQKITQQRDVILELQDKLKHQTEKLDKTTKLIASQKQCLQNSQRGKLKLRKDLTLERKRGREILSKLLEFFQHIDNEFSFTINALNGKFAEDSNKLECASVSATDVIGIENKLKQMSIGVANKLKNIEAERMTELQKVKEIVNQITAKNTTTTNTTSTQTNVTSIDFDESVYLASSKFPDLSPILINHQSPVRLRLKGAHYKFQQQNDLEVSVDTSKKPKVTKVKEDIDNIKVIPTVSMIALNTNYLDSDKRHEMATEKHELNLLYCACGLTFSSQEWLNNHIKLFDTLWGSEKDAMKGNVCGKVHQKSIIQNLVIHNKQQQK